MWYIPLFLAVIYIQIFHAFNSVKKGFIEGNYPKFSTMLLSMMFQTYCGEKISGSPRFFLPTQHNALAVKKN